MGPKHYCFRMRLFPASVLAVNRCISHDAIQFFGSANGSAKSP